MADPFKDITLEEFEETTKAIDTRKNILETNPGDKVKVVKPKTQGDAILESLRLNPMTFGAAFAAIYNNSKSDKLVVVLDFGGTKSCSNGTFTITFPSTSSGTPAGTDSLISITS